MKCPSRRRPMTVLCCVRVVPLWVLRRSSRSLSHTKRALSTAICTLSIQGKVARTHGWNASKNKNEYGGSNDVQYLDSKKVTTDWTTISWTFPATFPHDRLQFCFGKLAGSIDFDDLVLTKDGSTDNLVANGDFATPSLKGWEGCLTNNCYQVYQYASQEGSAAGI